MRRWGMRSRNPFLQREGLPKFEPFTPEAYKEVRLPIVAVESSRRFFCARHGTV